MSMNHGTCIGGKKFHHITLSTHSQPRGADPQSSGDKNAWPFFNEIVFVSIVMDGFSFGGQSVLCPLLLQVNQCPLSLAKQEVLYARDHQVLFFRIAHIFRSQVTPWGSWSVSTVTS